MKIRSDDSNPFDGVICFGGVDWWYHNRGHYDLQMMREFSRKIPVLYINSIGMRAPKVCEGGMFFKRVIRKLKSLARGLVKVNSMFHVFSPVTLPGGGKKGILKTISQLALSLQVRVAARRCGIVNPLIWIAIPTAEPMLNYLTPARLIYQRTDRFENFAGVNREQICKHDFILKQQANLVLFCSRELYEDEKDACDNAFFIDHGVDFERFATAGQKSQQSGGGPADMSTIARPRIGFIGGLDSHTFDPDLFCTIATKLPDKQFILVGGCSLPDDWCTLPNVHQLGQKPYDCVADYMAACDILIMPWNQSDWIKACNPVKMKEYLAVGRPIVSTDFPEVHFYTPQIQIAGTSTSFSKSIEDAIDNPGNSDRRRDRVRDHTWKKKANQVWRAIG